MPRFDEQGQWIRGKENQEAAKTALAKVQVATSAGEAGVLERQRWLVARVRSESASVATTSETVATNRLMRDAL